jgi:hypothetical protein
MADAVGEFEFAGDAIADLLTGIQAALAAWRSWLCGGGRLIDLALADVAAAGLAEAFADMGEGRLHQSLAEWWKRVRGRRLGSAGVRVPDEPVRPLGADTAAVLAEMAAAC